jgi:hypothetical protein
MSVEEGYIPSEYGNDVNEGNLVEWNLPEKPNIFRHDEPEPDSGDKIILFFCKTGFRRKGKSSGIRGKPGIYGLGTIKYFNRSEKHIHFMPDSPSDKLKKTPLWNDEIKGLIRHIRKNTPNQGTMWIISTGQSNTFKRLLDEWISNQNECCAESR